MCGGNHWTGSLSLSSGGSPPRVWGKFKILCDKFNGNRITPTRVGKSVGSHRSLRYDQDHPHACGENWERVCLHSALTGSPPRVWGKYLKLFSKAYHSSQSKLFTVRKVSRIFNEFISPYPKHFTTPESPPANASLKRETVSEQLFPFIISSLLPLSTYFYKIINFCYKNRRRKPTSL